MTDSITDAIEEAKSAKRKANALDAMQELSDQGMFPKEGSDKPSAFETSAKNITTAMHDPANPETAELHSAYPDNVLAPAYEMHVIQKAAKEENDVFKKENTVDRITQLENDIIVKEMEQNVKHLDRELPALHGRARDDGVKDLGSLVAGENARTMALGGGMPIEPQGNVLKRLARWAAGK